MHDLANMSVGKKSKPAQCEFPLKSVSEVQQIQRTESRHQFNRSDTSKTIMKMNHFKVKLCKMFSYPKKKPVKLNLLKKSNNEEERNENIYVTIRELHKKNTEVANPIFKLDLSECASCIFGDQSLTCTCNFRSNSHDFKLYEDW